MNQGKETNCIDLTTLENAMFIQCPNAGTVEVEGKERSVVVMGSETIPYLSGLQLFSSLILFLRALFIVFGMFETSDV